MTIKIYQPVLGYVPLALDDFMFCHMTMMLSVLSVIASLNTSFKNFSICFTMYKNPCLKAAKYTRIQTASVFDSVCHHQILNHQALKDPCPRDPSTRLGWSMASILYSKYFFFLFS